MGRSVAETLVRTLCARGTRRMFGVPGGGSSLDVIEAGAGHGLDFVLARSESAAAIMAATTAELCGAPGVVLTGLGPGAAAVANGLAHASLDRGPLLLITDAYPPDVRSFVTHQRIDHAALFAPLIKASLTPTTATSPLDLENLLDLALAPPQGPVHLDLSSRAAAETMADAVRATEPRPVQNLSGEIEKARALLAKAERPVLLVGLEARRAAAAARALAADLRGPVLTTWKARGVVADGDPHVVGSFTGGEAEAACVAKADLIVQLGLDPVELIPQRWRFRAPILDLALAPREARYASPAVSLIGPLAASAQALMGVARRSAWDPKEIRSLRADMVERQTMAPAAGIGPQAVVEAAFETAPAGCRATVDAGAHMFPVMAFWQAREAGAVLISNGLATMGFALPAAIASALEEPERPVVAFTGDGGLAMVLGELATAAERSCALVIVVFNDAALSLIELKQRGRDLSSRGCRTMPVDFAAAARAFGFEAERVTDLAALRPTLARAFAARRPALVDVSMDPHGYPALLAALRG